MLVSQLRCQSCGNKTFIIFRYFDEAWKRFSNIGKCMACEEETPIDEKSYRII